MAIQVRYFVNERKEKGIRIKVVVNGDDVSVPFRVRTVVAVLGCAAFCNAKMDVQMHNPVDADVYCIGRDVFREDFMNFGVCHLGKNEKSGGNLRGRDGKVIDRNEFAIR
jgi:hypothetical protein